MKKLNFLQKQLIKHASKYLNKHKAIEVSINSKLLLNGRIYYVTSYEARRAFGEDDSLSLEAKVPNWNL